jgi:hypothetical protein
MFFAGRTFSDDRALLALRRELALGTDQVPEPPLEATSKLSAPLIKSCAAVALAALIAAVLVWLPGARRNANEIKQSGDLPVLIAKEVRSLDEMQSAPVAAPPFIPAPEVALRNTPISKPETALRGGNPPSGSGPALDSRTAAVASGPASGAMSTSEGAVELTNNEIAMLLNLGKDFFKDGDLVSARLLFRRAAAAGNAEAAFVLGRTFDPVVADRMGVIGIKPDIARARQWYERAAELGSPAASQELARLQRCS